MFRNQTLEEVFTAKELIPGRHNGNIAVPASAPDEVLSSPARIRILQVIATAQVAGFSQIKAETSLSTGSIYHHLTKLSGYVEKNSEGKYVLTGKGAELLGQLSGGQMPSPPFGSRPWESALDLLTLARVMRFWTKSARRSLGVTSALLLLGAFAYEGSPLNQVLLAAPRLQLLHPVVSVILTGWLLTFLVGEVYAGATTRRWRGGEIELAAGVATGLAPMFVYVAAFRWVATFSEVVLVPLQLWGALILAAALNLSKGVRFSHALILSLLVLYASTSVWLLALR